MKILDNPEKRVKYILKDLRIMQKDWAIAADMSESAISEMLKHGISFKGLLGLKKVDARINLNWVGTGEGSPLLDQPGKTMDTYLYIDDSILISKIEEIDKRLELLEKKQ